MYLNFKFHHIVPKIPNIIWKTNKDLHSTIQNTPLKTRKIHNRQVQLMLVPGIQSMYRYVSLVLFLIIYYKHH